MEQERCETGRLVESIEKRLGRRLNISVRDAFLQIPRHLFIEHYYRQQGNRLAWDRIAQPTMADIYADEALVTKIDEQGHPISSSSQPSVMAYQLEKLDLCPGLSALEIGVGTGFNAALMSRLVSPGGRVTSIDIDQGMVEAARRHLSAANGEGVCAMKSDGFYGYPEHAPYDRILATCAVRAIPCAWVTQLATNGLLLVNLRLNLSSIFLILKKGASAALEGYAFDMDAAYMEMHGAEGVPKPLQVNWNTYDTQPHQELQLPTNLTTLLACPAYSVLLECLLPSLRKKYRVFPGETTIHTYLIDVASPGDALQVQDDRVTIIGSQEHLKTQLLQSMELYEQFHVTLEDYRITFAEGKLFCSLDTLCFPLGR